MTAPTTDRDHLEEAFRVYDEAFAAHVGEIVTPYEYLDHETQVDWAARIFMFAYGLGAVAHAQATDTRENGETDLERVEGIVDDVVDIHASDAFEVSTERVRQDFLEMTPDGTSQQ